LVEGSGALSVVLAARAQRPGQLVLSPRLGLAAELLECSPEAVVRVVVRGRELGHRAELRLSLLVAPHAQVGDAERLADRRLVGLPRLRLLERDGGLGGPAPFPNG